MFADDSPLAITLVATLSQARSERDKKTVYPGEVRWQGSTFPVEVTLRGNRRLNREVCAFLPLRLNFDKKGVANSVFEGQTDLKLVVRCRADSRHADYLRSEFLIYKALNLLTPLSYSVRWVDVTYADSDKRMEDRTEGAFFVERLGRLAKRNGGESVAVEKIEVAQLDAPAAALLNLFQFLIANPDYSMISPPPSGECCHNAKLVTGPNPNTYTPMIYDFDSSGAISAKYAVSSAVLKIDKVTERVYMGYCEQNGDLPNARAQLLALRAQLIAVSSDDTFLSQAKKARIMRFLQTGFEILADDRTFERKVVGACR